ncbi:tripartite tricarboxylate transporter TctB family protein [Oceaniglobus ichthyenteri]|uniref:tripartite tricarboxylate transporter TctB family protein n=1 Tax=Oceaniglobus ichthyenteri TaxID=2136177 RepID=UPI000D3C261F|nr:tripartite tricarboxylate transporter TctB family protein [Oceaniglobus ichthyenteri]
MDPEFRGDSDHHDGTSDAIPGGYPKQRRPGELVFALFLTAASLGLLYNAYGIAGFESLSSAGSVPMAVTLAMSISAIVIVIRTARRPMVKTETLSKDILPGTALFFIALLVVFSVLLKPLGFVPTAALFLIVSIKLLARKSWIYTLSISLGSLFVIWVTFRVVFTVLLPTGILPEAEFLQFFRNLTVGGPS